MAYSELIKDFNRIRDYMREFYIYGFKSRDEYTKKSVRSYDNERRRIESWLGNHMRFRQTADGKNVFISIDSRVSKHNPLYSAWKTKSFTDGDITLHFILFDILHSPDIVLTLNEITDMIYSYLNSFSIPKTFDESTVRKKLKEYISEGLIVSKKQGKLIYYHRAEDFSKTDPDVADFFSEISPCGVIGSFILDKLDAHEDYFYFKHHYITSTMDSEILCSIFLAMGDKRFVTLETSDRLNEKHTIKNFVPLHVMISVQNGRQYVMGFSDQKGTIFSVRTDSIISVTPGDVCQEYEKHLEDFSSMKPHLWNIGTYNSSGTELEHVEFTITYSDDEKYIPARLIREKRCGTVEETGHNTLRFSADVYDSNELIPWIRTFICRITDLSFSNKELESRFKNDLLEMYSLYGLKDGDANDI